MNPDPETRMEAPWSVSSRVVLSTCVASSTEAKEGDALPLGETETDRDGEGEDDGDEDSDGGEWDGEELVVGSPERSLVTQHDLETLPNGHDLAVILTFAHFFVTFSDKIHCT